MGAGDGADCVVLNAQPTCQIHILIYLSVYTFVLYMQGQLCLYSKTNHVGMCITKCFTYLY